LFLFSPINFTFLAVFFPPLVNTMGLPLMTTPRTGTNVPSFCGELPMKMVSSTNRLFPSIKGTNLTLPSAARKEGGSLLVVEGVVVVVPTVAFFGSSEFWLTARSCNCFPGIKNVAWTWISFGFPQPAKAAKGKTKKPTAKIARTNRPATFVNLDGLIWLRETCFMVVSFSLTVLRGSENGLDGRKTSFRESHQLSVFYQTGSHYVSEYVTTQQKCS